MGRLEQSLRKLAYAKSPDFDHVVQAYKDLYGVDLSHMRMKWSKHPVYNNGRRSYDFADDETGGSWVDDGTVRINPKMGPVLKRFGIEGMTQAEFRRRLIAHELAHEVWHNQVHKKRIKKLIRDSLRQARKENFTTPYLDTYSTDTPRKKFDSELFAEWMSHQLNKKAESRLYTYLPKDNTADVDGILSTALTENGWEKYRGRTRRKTREAVLRALDAMEPDWRRSMSVSALAEPIPDDAAEDLKEFARSNRLYSFDVDDLVKAKILKHLRETNKGKGTHEAKSVSKGSPDWKRKPGKLLFRGIPHYMVETEGGRIPAELIRSEKKAQAYDKKKWPDYEDYLKKHPDPKIELVERLVREHYAKQRPWGMKMENGSFIPKDKVTREAILDAVVRDGDDILRQRRGMCHELAAARMKMLKDNGIEAHRAFAFWGEPATKQAPDGDWLLGHSMVFFRGDDGKIHFASPKMRDRPRKNFGRFDDLKDAIRQYIAAIRDSGGIRDDDFVRIYDTTDVKFPDRTKYLDYVRLAKKGPVLYEQAPEREFV